MSKSFEALANSLGLRSLDAENLKAALTRDSQTNKTSPACTAARVLLGSDIVDTLPLNQATVDVNWCIHLCTHADNTEAQKANAYAGLKRAGNSQITSFSQGQHRTLLLLKVIRHFDVPFAVRSGGHSPNPGFSSIEAGILIDLSRLDGISVSHNREAVSIGPGQRWGAVYNALDPYNVSVIGGRIPNVWVGGLILGGFSHFSSEYGLAADNVKSFEVVLADGIITTASSTENSDLFWALKGGGPNFGIVTSYDLYTVPVHSIWYEVLVIRNEDAHAVLDAFVLWQTTTASSYTKGTIGLAFGLQSITLGFIYSEPTTERPAAFSAFDGITPLATAVPPTNGTVASISAILSVSDNPGRHDYRSTATRIDAQLYKDVYDFWLPNAQAVNVATGANQTFALQPILLELVDAGKAKGGNPMGIPKENHQWWTTFIDWEKAADDEAVRNVSISTSAKWKELGEKRGLYIDYIYTNDASKDQSPIATYGEANIAKL